MLLRNVNNCTSSYGTWNCTQFFFSPVNYDATYMPGQSRVMQFSLHVRPGRFNTNYAILQKCIPYPQTCPMGLMEVMGITSVMGQRSE